MNKIIPVLFFFFALNTLPAQTFTGNGGDIPDDGNSIDFPITVSGLPNVLDTMSFGLESVCFNITHTWTADLAVWLYAPDGTIIPLVSNIGGDTDGFVNTCLNGNASSSIFQQWYPFTGAFRPFGDMGLINTKNINPNGTWTLHILDTYAFADLGSLSDWSITFGPQPSKPFPFYSSDLPILKINTSGQVIVNEPKIDASLQVIDNGPGQRNFANQTDYAFEGRIGIELRGFSSQSFPKKSYAMEVRDENGEDLDVSLLGMAKTSDYALAANFSDKTLMRNALAYETFRQLGHYASRTRFCEVVLDNSYQGIYILTEKIKRGEDQVDISKLTLADTLGTDITGGYILRIDWNTSPGWYSQFPQPNNPGGRSYFQHEYPDFDRMHPAQVDYIRTYVDSFEVALQSNDYQDINEGWRKYADERSFIDYLLVNEISRNVDGYRLSTYFHKKRDDKGGKLNMGPPWDYDLAFYNADYCDGFSTSGWAYDINYVCWDAGGPFWWERLVSDPVFAQNTACRWQTLRNDGLMSHQHYFGIIDSMASVLSEAQGRNFTLWPILGTYVWPNPGPLPTTHLGEVAKMKNWLNERLEWLDGAFGQYLLSLNADFQASPTSAFSWQFNAPPGYQYAWDFGDGSTSSEAAPEHQFPGAGAYTVQLTISTLYGCSEVSSQTIVVGNTGTGVVETAAFQVSPNPAIDQILIKMPENVGTTPTLRLINALGQTVSVTAFAPGERQHILPVAGLPAGAYALEIQSNVRQTIRVVIGQ